MKTLGLVLFFAVALGAQSGRLVVHMMLHAIGTESYEMRGGVLRVSSEYNDRGRKAVATAEWSLGADLTPGAYNSQRSNGKESGGMPASVQMILVRSWLAHGRPSQITAPGAAAGAPEIEIRRVGDDTLDGAKLERFTLANVVFGREVMWLDGEQKLAGLMTFGGGLPWEYIASPYEPELEEFFKLGVAQELADLQELGRAAPAEASGSFAIVGATLVDGTGRAPVEDAVVVVRDGRIVAAGGRGSVAIPSGVRMIEAAGKTLLPGLWEMHTHYSGVEFGPAQLAAGITTARDCGGELAFLTAVRDAIDQHGALGPHLLLAGLIDAKGLVGFGDTLADTPEEGRAAVERYHAAGFPQVKLYNQLEPDVILAITDEAHQLGMSVTGHVPDAINALQGIDLGMDQINHLGYVTPVLRTAGAPLEVKGAKASAAIGFLLAHHTVVDPTASWSEMASHPETISVESFEPGILKAPQVLAARYEGFATPAAGAARWQARMAEDQTIIGALYHAGVHLVAGSDTGLLGYGLDRELEIYVNSGLTPMQAIQVATLGSAEAMGMARESGSIEAGKRADMMLVDADPLEDIRNLRKVSKVVAQGRMYDSAKLWESVGFKPSH